MIEHSLPSIILGIIVTILGYMYATKSRRSLRENFLPSMSFKVDRVAAPNQDFASKGEFWSVPGTYHSLVPPRTASIQYGSQLQYNLPSENMLAFSQSSPFANEGLLVGEDPVQPITYDRFMFSNKKSRLRALGDPIRGDLPIAPYSSDWFRPSVQPHLDLKEGAMQVMGGFDNETNNQLSQLMSVSAGRAMQTFGGVAFSGADGLGAQMGAFLGNSANVDADPSPTLSRFADAPIVSNSLHRVGATGMVPQNYTSVAPNGDINVVRG